MGKIIIDAGPLVALLNSNDQFHPWAGKTVVRFEPPLITCDAVLSETCHLLEKRPLGLVKLRRMVDEKIINSSFISHAELPALFALMARYHDVPMSYADACLVSMVEQNPDSSLLTTDRDFKIYRQHRRRLIPLIAPF